MPKYSFKKPLLLLPPCLFLLTALLLFVLHKTESARLEALEETLLQTAYAEDTLSLHFALSNPGLFSLSEEPAALPVYSGAAHADQAAFLSRMQDDALHIHGLFFSPEEMLRLSLLRHYAADELAGAAFPYYAEPLSPSSGAQSGLPVLLAEYSFRKPEDVEHYLDLLEQIPAYLEGLAVYEQEKAQAGLFMSDASAEAVIRQCSDLMSKEELADGSHFLCQTFAERLDVLCQEGTLTAAEKEHYLAENNRLLTTVVAPAYEKLADTMFLLSGNRPETTGLAAFPQGKEYYEYLAARSTGSSRTIPEYKRLLIDRLREDFHAIAALSAANTGLLSSPDALEDLSSRTAALLPDTPETMLADLKQQMHSSFPALSRNGSPLPDDYVGCQIKAVSDCLEPYVSPAYYFTPPADDVRNNTIYINHSQTPHGLQLYTTLAHEGYPGHLYQSVFFQLGQDHTLPPARSLYYYGGYVEGWALYVEMLSYDYALHTIQDAGQPEDAAAFLCKLERLDRDMQLCLYSLLDISIHYDGASEKQIQKVLARFGISARTASALYRYIAEEPANYLKYYIGYLEILECREYAKAIWKEDYSDKRFHTFFLELGPCSFDVVREQIKKETPSTDRRP